MIVKSMWNDRNIAGAIGDLELRIYRALPARDIFDVEYWDLEQAKLKKGGKPPAIAGEVALVTWAASGIGKACCESLLARGAAVVRVDRNPAGKARYRRQDYPGNACDLTDPAVIPQILEQAADRYGGLDILVLNAGVFPGGRRINKLASEEWRRVMTINLDANHALMREGNPLPKLAPRGGAGLGQRQHPHQQLASRRRLRYRLVDRRSAGFPRQALWPQHRRVQAQQRAQDGGDGPRRGGTGGGVMRHLICQDDRCAIAGRWWQR